MHLLSSSKSTILSEFPNLETISSYCNANNESTEFRFCAQQSLYVEVNKKSGIELMRIKEKENQKLEILRVRKITVPSVSCVACAKQAPEEIAFGFPNGTVKTYNLPTSKIEKQFTADNKRSAVLFMDYNASDEYICSVCENGQIDIYGTKTIAKIDTVQIDDHTTLARFHPTKRFHMGVASYKGAVSMYDIQNKRKYFHNTESHTAPCRDLCMSPATPDTLISAGFDCLINVFDTRRKAQVSQLSHDHPLSTVAFSECGTFFCVGNLKGDITAYDMRKLKCSLVTKKVHNCAITRMSFMPLDADVAESFYSTGSTANASVTTSECSHTDRPHGGGELRKSVASKLMQDKTARGQRDSFCDLLDYQAKGSEKNPTHKLRESNDFWDAIHRKSSGNDQCASMSQLRVSDVHSHSKSASNFSAMAGDYSFENKSELKKKSTGSLKSHVNQGAAPQPLREQSNNIVTTPSNKLVKIQEEQSEQNISSGSDKENPPLDLDLQSRFQKLSANCNSTPNRAERLSNIYQSMPDVNPNSSTLSVAELRDEMNTRFQQLESEIKFQLETNKWQIFTQNFNLWSKLNQNNEAITDALGILLQTDPFVNEFLRLKQENEELKNKILSMTRK